MATAAVGTEAAATEQGGPSLMQTFHDSQRQVARLSVPEEARLIVELGRWAPSPHLPVHMRRNHPLYVGLFRSYPPLVFGAGASSLA